MDKEVPGSNFAGSASLPSSIVILIIARKVSSRNNNR
jgi:hypothetical protein